jgi:hypothetical protein
MSKHHASKEMAVKEIMRLLKKNNLRFSDVSAPLEAASMAEISVPLTIYSEALTPLESTVKYLRENKEMKFSEIGPVLGRDQKAVAITYRAASRKVKAAFNESEASVFVPASIFNSKSLSAFEALVVYLRKTHSILEISKVLGKDYRTVWTIYSRATAKRAKNAR